SEDWRVNCTYSPAAGGLTCSTFGRQSRQLKPAASREPGSGCLCNPPSLETYSNFIRATPVTASIELEHSQRILPQIATAPIIVQRNLPALARAALKRNQGMVTCPHQTIGAARVGQVPQFGGNIFGRPCRRD